MILFILFTAEDFKLSLKINRVNKSIIESL